MVLLLSVMAGKYLNAEPPSHDPATMIQNLDERYWIFTTGNGIWCMSSGNSNFTDWRVESTPFPSDTWPGWIGNYVRGFGGHFWAPDIIKIDDKYFLYYSCAGIGAPAAIGLTTASNLNGPWTDQGMVVAAILVYALIGIWPQTARAVGRAPAARVILPITTALDALAGAIRPLLPGEMTAQIREGYRFFTQTRKDLEEAVDTVGEVGETVREYGEKVQESAAVADSLTSLVTPPPE